jgi:hypothetical protein
VDSPQPTPEQIDELKAQIAALERRIAALDAEHEDRIAAIEAACRAFAVVFAIPRITPGDGDNS